MAVRTAFLAACLLLAGNGAAHAVEPAVGGWRNLPIGPAYSVSEKSTPFVMLPGDVAKGTRFRVMDLSRWQAVCCLQTTSPRLQRDTLIHSYGVPVVWAADLGSWLNNDKETEAHVFAVRRVDRLAGYAFEGDADSNGESGGLLLPDDAKAVAPDKVVVGGTTYRVKRTEGSLTDGDGGWESFQLVPDAGGAATTVDIRYGTN
ncbi:hypothetical protein KQ945_11625 [Bacillus subtilis subsp. subtilis]|nr:hypothetical protein [Bacillus subtilis subsp. subtilis]